MSLASHFTVRSSKAVGGAHLAFAAHPLEFRRDIGRNKPAKLQQERTSWPANLAGKTFRLLLAATSVPLCYHSVNNVPNNQRSHSPEDPPTIPGRADFFRERPARRSRTRV